MLNSKVKKMRRKIKNELGIFLKDESGLMSKDNIIKIGIGTISAFSLLASSAQAADVSGSQDAGEAGMLPSYVHTNADVMKWSGGTATGTAPKALFPSHVHHAVHESY
jgi:hypothetical protein